MNPTDNPYEIGDLVHIPSGVSLKGLDGYVRTFTDKPTRGIICERHLGDDYRVIVYEKEWLVDKRFLFPIM